MSEELDSGAILGRYRLQRILGRGGMGIVWLANDEVLQRDVAVKVLPHDLPTEGSTRRRFEREAKVTAGLVHPNVVTIFDVGTADTGDGSDTPYLVMELLDGRPLNELLEQGPLSVRLAVEIATQIAQALAAAHASGVIHRDLKPANVMILPGHHVKVLDFGLARLMGTNVDPATTLTKSGTVLGSCSYMSPEQAMGSKIGSSSDVFSFGAILYEMITGTRAFSGSSPIFVLEAVVKGKRRPLREVSPDVPHPLEAIIERCLNMDPDHRYRDGAALASDLELLDPLSLIVPDGPDAAARTLPLFEAVSLQQRRTRRRTAGVAVVATMLAIVVGALAGKWAREPLRPDPGSWTTTKVLTSRGILRQPAWSPDGKELALSHLRGGHGELLAVDLESGSQRIVATGASGEVMSWPRFSPDGRTLAVTITGGSAERVEVLPSVGGPAVLTVQAAARASWANDGSLLVARYEEGRPTIWRHDVRTNEETKVLAVAEDTGWWDARAGTDGRLAILGGAVDVRGSLWVMDQKGQLDRWMAPGPTISGYAWAPGGRSLVAVLRESLVRIRKDRVDGVLPDIAGLVDPAPSPDGSRLAMVRRLRKQDLVATDPNGQGWECRLCGEPGTLWGTGVADGSLVFARRSGSSNRLIRRFPTGEEIDLLPPGENASCPVVDPSARRLAYLVTRPSAPKELWVADLQGGSPLQIATDVEASELPSWAPDGRRITYAAGTPLGVWVASIGMDEPQRIADGDYPQWSPGGAWIAYLVWTDESDPDQGVWVISPDGSGARKIGDVPSQISWRPDGQALWQIRRAGEVLELWSCQLESWSWELVAPLDFGGPAYPYQEHVPFSVEPTTGKLLLNLRRDAGELVVFEGLESNRW